MRKTGFLQGVGKPRSGRLETHPAEVNFVQSSLFAAARRRDMNVRFVVIAPESHACTRDVGLPVLIGRADDAKFRIRDERISRRHCELIEDEGVVRIRDLGSTNGTFLNDEQLETDVAVEVAPDAVVRVGSCVFRVEYEPPAAPPPVDEASASGGEAGTAVDDGSPAAGVTEEPTAFAFQIDNGKEPTVNAEPDEWLPPAEDGEANQDAGGDDALGDFLKGLQ